MDQNKFGSFFHAINKQAFFSLMLFVFLMAVGNTVQAQVKGPNVKQVTFGNAGVDATLGRFLRKARQRQSDVGCQQACQAQRNYSLTIQHGGLLHLDQNGRSVKIKKIASSALPKTRIFILIYSFNIIFFYFVLRLVQNLFL